MPQVICFDDRKAEKELKSCPKIVRDYVKLLKRSNENWQELTGKAVGKLRENQINSLSSFLNWHQSENLGVDVDPVERAKEYLELIKES